jgi:2-oxoisovalerate dehydrogenase E2 component (dihydrolipoyl transacylase)
MTTTKTFLLPDLGEGLTEAELLAWLVAVGDTVELNQIIAEVETAKASVELPSPYAGIVVALHAQAGSTIEVGSPFIEVAVAVADAHTPEPSGSRPEPAAAQTPVLVGYGVAEETTTRRRRRAKPAEKIASNGSTPVPHRVPGRPLATPPVRFAAKQRGIDLASVSATGEHGEVTRADLELHCATLTRAGAPTTTASGDEIRTPIKGVRKHTAAAVVRSAFTVPHVTEFVTVDVTPTLEFIDQLRTSKAFTGARLTPLTLVAKAVLVALRTNPSLNSMWDEDAQEIITKKYVNLGIAAATPRGLMVPNIKDAQQLSMVDLAQALSDLTATAKSGKTGPEDLAGGTITITNIGVFGVDSGTPIINPGEAAIVCFGAIRRQPWEYRGDIALRSVTTLSLSFDHRLVDGQQGSVFLATVADILADPTMLITLT